GTPLNADITSVAAGAAPGSDLSDGLLANAGSYNFKLARGTGQFGLQSAIVPGVIRKFLTATVRHELSPRIEAFTVVTTQSNSTSTPSNPLAFLGGFLVPSTTPTNPFGEDVYVSFPSALSPRTTSDSVTQSATVGLIGRLAAEWTSELDYTWSRNSFET